MDKPWKRIPAPEIFLAITEKVKDPELSRLQDVINEHATKDKKHYIFLAQIILSDVVTTQKVLDAATDPEKLHEVIKSELTVQINLDNHLRARSSTKTFVHSLLEYIKDSKNVDVGAAIAKVLSTEDIILSKSLMQCKLLKMMSSTDMEKVKKHYVAAFAKDKILDKAKLLCSYDMIELIELLNDKRLSNLKIWPTEHLTMKNVAVVLSHCYDLEELVPILDTYQGNLALEGTVPNGGFLSDIHAYLKEDHNAVPPYQSIAPIG